MSNLESRIDSGCGNLWTEVPRLIPGRILLGETIPYRGVRRYFTLSSLPQNSGSRSPWLGHTSVSICFHPLSSFSNLKFPFAFTDYNPHHRTLEASETYDLVTCLSPNLFVSSPLFQFKIPVCIHWLSSSPHNSRNIRGSWLDFHFYSFPVPLSNLKFSCAFIVSHSRLLLLLNQELCISSSFSSSPQNCRSIRRPWLGHAFVIKYFRLLSPFPI